MLFWVKMSISEGIYLLSCKMSVCQKMFVVRMCKRNGFFVFWFVAELFGEKVPETAPLRYAAFTARTPKN